MNPSQVYFSNTPILNHSSLNANWLLISTYLKNSDDKNPFIYFSKEEANTIVDSLYSVKKDTTIKIIDNNNPNVVLFIIESFTADVVAELEGEVNVTPHFSKIIEDGLLFTNIYSSSDRTDKGIISILSAFPSQGSKSIIKENEKQEKLPSIPTELRKATYNTSFFYGGYSEFSNFKSYILSHQFQHLEDADLYERKDLTSKWGAYDEVTFNRHLNYLNKEKQPFFSTLLTLTNHEPFALPQKGQFGNKTVEDKFRSTSYYTSKHLFEYLNKAKKESWYKNTIFIFVADHGHRLPKNENEIYNPNRYHIPLLIYGEPLKKEFRGKKINTIGNQTDIAATLLAQLNLSSKQFKYSKNLMNPYAKSFSFYVWQDGFGFIDHQGSLSFDREANKTIYTNPKNIQQNQYKYYLNNGKALMQSVYQNYLDNQYQ
ncbi:LTA synthase family protein [Pseudopedobacter beijingensis]|uniref:LTA synthase family protein n=1 Tax=Pseudopedobacter beijingensis TaxID=1207056 RepID=A0ABW4IFB6_9SPHI